MGVFEGDPECGQGRRSPEALRQGAGEGGEEAGLQGFGEAEEDEEEPGGGGGNAGMVFKRPLDPVAEAEPVDSAGGKAQGEADQGTRFAGGGDEDGCEGYGGEDGEVVVREEGDEDQRSE